MRKRLRSVALILVLSWPVVGWAGVYKTQEQALTEVFPGGYERVTKFLTEEQIRGAEKRSRSRVESKIVTYYVGRTADGEPAGMAFFDTHTVRTSKEILFVWIEPRGSVAGLEILAFYEPEDYKIRPGWLARMKGKNGKDELTLGRDLDGVTGATLTVRALSAAVRRSLALYQSFSGDK